MPTPPLKVNGLQCVAGGAGVDADAAGSLSLGATNATTVIVGRNGNTTAIPSKVAIAAPAAASGNALTVTGNATNFSAQALFKDSNGNAHFGIDSAGLPSLGTYFMFREDWSWGSAQANSTSTPVTNSSNRWAYTNVTSTGLTFFASTVSPASASMTINPGTATSSVGLLATQVNLVNPNNLANLYVVLEWESFLSTVGANNVTYVQGIGNTNLASAAHPGGWYFQKASGDTNWQAITDDGTTTNSQNSGVAPAANTLQYFRIEYFGSGSFTGAKTVKFYINNALVATSTSNVYSGGAMAPQFGAKVTNTASNQSITVGPLMLMFNRVAVPFAP